jgi:hypothetical protein
VNPVVRLEDMLEKEWQRQVVQLAKTLGYRTYHTFDSRRSTHGFPDLVLVRDRVIYLELKREKGRLTEEQKGWLRALRAAGAEAYVARPRDLEALGRTLAAYGRDAPGVATVLNMRTRRELVPGGEVVARGGVD